MNKLMYSMKLPCVWSAPLRGFYPPRDRNKWSDAMSLSKVFAEVNSCRLTTEMVAGVCMCDSGRTIQNTFSNLQTQVQVCFEVNEPEASAEKYYPGSGSATNRGSPLREAVCWADEFAFERWQTSMKTVHRFRVFCSVRDIIVHRLHPSAGSFSIQQLRSNDRAQLQPGKGSPLSQRPEGGWGGGIKGRLSCQLSRDWNSG